MVVAITVTGEKRVLKLLNNLEIKLPKEIAKGGFELMKLMQRNMRLQMSRNKSVVSGQAWRSIQARRQTKDRSVLVMSQRAVWLDRMPPHYVKLKRGRLIRKWALQKGNAAVKSIAAREGSIFVRPHPFFDAGFSRSMVNFRKIMKRRKDKALAS